MINIINIRYYSITTRAIKRINCNNIILFLFELRLAKVEIPAVFETLLITRCIF
ncbi:hypothetical protein HMPREF2532_03735 [Bacteroides ovatus]|nr:hypothetical protein HMPREF2532_03735 [Bacteroides ovatus]